jgi:hypothetical protein
MRALRGRRGAYINARRASGRIPDMASASASASAPDARAHSQWNLCLKAALAERTAGRAARAALNTALREPREPNAIGAPAPGGNFADMMRPDSRVFEEYGLAADFAFAPLDDPARNTVMQVCAWDEDVPGSTVSGCIELRSTCNVSTLIEARDIVMPLSVYAVNRRRFETLRAALREQPTLAGALDALCDVFENHDSVAFAAPAPPANEVIPLAGGAPGATAFVNVNSSHYTAARAADRGEPRDLDVQRVEVAFHPRVGTKIFLAESVRVRDKTSGATACFVMSNHAAGEAASGVPRTAAHLLGFPCNLVAASATNALEAPRHALPDQAHTVVAALAVLRSLAAAAATAAPDAPAARAFDALRADPQLARAAVASSRAHPGLRLLALDVAGPTPGGPPRKLVLLLTAVLDCHDAHLAHLAAAAAAAADAAPNAAPALGLSLGGLWDAAKNGYKAYNDTNELPRNVAEIRHDVKEILSEVKNLRREVATHDAEARSDVTHGSAGSYQRATQRPPPPSRGPLPELTDEKTSPAGITGFADAQQEPSETELEQASGLRKVKEAAEDYADRWKFSRGRDNAGTVMDYCTKALSKLRHIPHENQAAAQCRWGLHYMGVIGPTLMERDQNRYEAECFPLIVRTIRALAGADAAPRRSEQPTEARLPPPRDQDMDARIQRGQWVSNKITGIIRDYYNQAGLRDLDARYHTPSDRTFAALGKLASRVQGGTSGRATTVVQAFEAAADWWARVPTRGAALSGLAGVAQYARETLSSVNSSRTKEDMLRTGLHGVLESVAEAFVSREDESEDEESGETPSLVSRRSSHPRRASAAADGNDDDGRHLDYIPPMVHTSAPRSTKVSHASNSFVRAPGDVTHQNEHGKAELVFPKNETRGQGILRGPSKTPSRASTRSDRTIPAREPPEGNNAFLPGHTHSTDIDPVDYGLMHRQASAARGPVAVPSLLAVPGARPGGIAAPAGFASLVAQAARRA